MMRDTIIRKIVELDLSGQSMHENAVQTTHELLYAASVSEFGSWETALQYAGIGARDVGRYRDLSPERIKQQLRRLCTTGYDLGAKVNQERDRPLYDAARQQFGGWRGALVAAGINLANVTHRKPKNLDREVMLLWLRNRHAAGQSLVYTEVCLENRDYVLAIRREFGSWARAMEVALPSIVVEEDETAT